MSGLLSCSFFVFFFIVSIRERSGSDSLSNTNLGPISWEVAAIWAGIIGSWPNAFFWDTGVRVACMCGWCVAGDKSRVSGGVDRYSPL